ncbi:hypothetical protein, partial [Agromyces salentinus]|uniref:hypothetical protein n=1 Tax=Agromyces salentinus TaxID=269421 RepID=UPI001BA54C43
FRFFLTAAATCMNLQAPTPTTQINPTSRACRTTPHHQNPRPDLKTVAISQARPLSGPEGRDRRLRQVWAGGLRHAGGTGLP